MEQIEVMRLLENMLNGAQELVDAARKEYAEVSKPESEKYMIRDLYYENLRYCIGNRDGINHALQNLKKYYFTEAAKKEAKTASAALYGKSVMEAEE